MAFKTLLIHSFWTIAYIALASATPSASQTSNSRTRDGGIISNNPTSFDRMPVPHMTDLQWQPRIHDSQQIPSSTSDALLDQFGDYLHDTYQVFFNHPETKSLDGVTVTLKPVMGATYISGAGAEAVVEALQGWLLRGFRGRHPTFDFQVWRDDRAQNLGWSTVVEGSLVVDGAGGLGLPEVD